MPATTTRDAPCVTARYSNAPQITKAFSSSISTGMVANNQTSWSIPNARRIQMREKEVLERAFAMPLTSPAYSPGPYRFVNREYLIITYRTDAAKLRAIVPEPLELNDREPLVKYEFIRMPDSNGFGDYTESGQVIPVSFRGRKGGYTHCMFLNDEGPIAGGRELWGFPKKLAQPTLRTETDTLVGTLDYGPVRSRDRHDGIQAP